jgi:hypothetical protein
VAEHGHRQPRCKPLPGSTLAAILVRLEDLSAAVVMPPPIYVVLELLAWALETAGAGGSWLRQQLLS